MNKKEYQNFSVDREIQNRFTAYVQEALKNTCSTYYTKKMIREERETVYDEANDLTVTDSGICWTRFFLLTWICWKIFLCGRP